MPGAIRQSDALMRRIGLVALRRIKAAFLIKMKGGVDESGLKWPPLSPVTIAYRRMRAGRGRTRAERKRPTMPSQALTTKQRDRWWALYRQGLVIFKGNKAAAARRAWTISKLEGATTLLAKYGGMNVDILRDTGLLLSSLSPGVRNEHSIFRVGAGEVVVGTDRKGAIYHHTGVPARRLPQRRLWPDPSNWPNSWWADLIDQLRQGLIDIAAAIATDP